MQPQTVTLRLDNLIKIFQTISVVTSQSERQHKLLKSTTTSFIVYFDDMSYVKLYNLLSSSALISANHAGKLVTLHLLTKERHIFCLQHSLMS